MGGHPGSIGDGRSERRPLLFRLERQASFRRFIELIFMQSGGMFQTTSFTKKCEVSHGTIRNYLQVLEATFVAYVIRPFSSHSPTEIVSAPKVYGFDTGFVCANRGWKTLRDEDRGMLFEHIVLNEMLAHVQSSRIRYWRDKQGHEIDFVLPMRGESAQIAIECKWKSDNFDERTIRAFVHRYPKAHIYVVANDVRRSWKRRVNGSVVEFVNIPLLMKRINNMLG